MLFWYLGGGGLEYSNSGSGGSVKVPSDGFPLCGGVVPSTRAGMIPCLKVG